MENGTYETKSCDDGRIVYVNHASDSNTWLWMCGPDDGRCPGAFHVGCEPDDSYTTTTTTKDPNNGSSSIISISVLTITLAFMTMSNV